MRRGLVAVLVLLALVLAGWTLLHRGRSVRRPPGTGEGDGAGGDDPAPAGGDRPGARSTATAGRPALPVERTVQDRGVRDEVRRRIFQAWAIPAPPPAPAAPAAVDPLRTPMPERDGGVDPEYLRQRIREDFAPMARTCYDSFLVRQPGQGGRMVVDFTIVGDEHVGGVVDEATAERDDAGFGDAELETCLRESMMAMAFRPPPRSGRLRVRYPFRFAAGTPDR